MLVVVVEQDLIRPFIKMQTVSRVVNRVQGALRVFQKIGRIKPAAAFFQRQGLQPLIIGVDDRIGQPVVLRFSGLRDRQNGLNHQNTVRRGGFQFIQQRGILGEEFFLPHKPHAVNAEGYDHPNRFYHPDGFRDGQLPPGAAHGEKAVCSHRLVIGAVYRIGVVPVDKGEIHHPVGAGIADKNGVVQIGLKALVRGRRVRPAAVIGVVGSIRKKVPEKGRAGIAPAGEKGVNIQSKYHAESSKANDQRSEKRRAYRMLFLPDGGGAL